MCHSVKNINNRVDKIGSNVGEKFDKQRQKVIANFECKTEDNYNDKMDEIKLMDSYNDNDNKLCVDNNDICYKYVRYIYDDGGWN